MKSYTIYECEITGKKFHDPKACQKHEAKAHRDVINKQIRAASKQLIEKTFADGLVDPSEEFVKQWIESWNKKYNNVNLEITMCSLRFEPMAGNTHCAPRGGDTNWDGRKKDVPRGYPGFVGRIEGRFVKPLRRYKDWTGQKKLLDSFSALCDDLYGFPGPEDVFRMRGLHSGSGGGGGSSFGYGVTLFVDDFPGLKRYVLKQELKR